ncbi:MAG: hypothetical protein KF852_14830 [Saprospiraceae bacterium]|nr:hypothetical protein [Saprospiraceae bacterium]
MSLLRRFFKSAPTSSAPDLRFGRYTDSYKQADNYKAWDRAVEAFENLEYLDSFRAFLEYLRDEREENIHWTDTGDEIRFELYQGSRLVNGLATGQLIKAESKLAKAKSLHVGYMRRLVEHNFDFKYCRYALDPDNNIVAVFDTFMLDGSPYKLYYAIKELATHADKQDDLLLEEFEALTPIAEAPMHELPDPEKKAKYEYILQETQRVLDIMNHGELDKDQYPGGIGYLLLHLVYKLDFFTQPQGFMMETLERMHRLYFTNDNRTAAQKNLLLAKELQNLIERPAALFYKEMYRTSATFGITTPVNHKQIADFIEGELPNMDWYCENGHPEVGLAVPGFIVGFCLFNYAPPKPVRQLLELYFQITESGFYTSLGYPSKYCDELGGELQRKAIRQAVKEIVEQNSSQYPGMQPLIGVLSYQSMPAFARSFLLMLSQMEVVKAF